MISNTAMVTTIIENRIFMICCRPTFLRYRAIIHALLSRAYDPSVTALARAFLCLQYFRFMVAESSGFYPCSHQQAVQETEIALQSAHVWNDPYDFHSLFL